MSDYIRSMALQVTLRVIVSNIGDRIGVRQVSHPDPTFNSLTCHLERSVSGVERSLIYEILRSTQNDHVVIVIELVDYYNPDMSRSNTHEYMSLDPLVPASTADRRGDDGQVCWGRLKMYLVIAVKC